MKSISEKIRAELLQDPGCSRDLTFVECEASGVPKVLSYFSRIFGSYFVSSDSTVLGDIDELGIDFLEKTTSIVIVFRSGHWALSSMQVFMVKTSDSPLMFGLEISLFIEDIDKKSNTSEEILFMIGVLSAWLNPTSFFLGLEGTSGYSALSSVSNYDLSSVLLSGLRSAGVGRCQ